MRILTALAFALLLAACTVAPPRNALVVPPHGVIGVDDGHLDPQFWIRRQAHPQGIVLDAKKIERQNLELMRLDASMNDLESLPRTLTAEQVKEWISNLSRRPSTTLFDESGRELSASTLDELSAKLNLDRIASNQPTRFGMVVRRANLRTFPTHLRAFSSQGETDIDRFQESALFPGTPVVIAHSSEDGEWLFVVSPRYEAWIEKQHVAEGSAEEVFGYTRRTPYVVVTGNTAHTVFTREQPAVSELQLDMGVRVPMLTEWPSDKPVNGQHPYASHVVELPVRTERGALQFTPALLPKTADVSIGYLPMTPANLLQQSFKFLGERYGWGHSYNARDCSGFVSEVYRSFGVHLPRNTRDQGVSPALNRIAFTEADSREKRLEVLRKLQVGDLIYIPGHVMMVIGHDAGMPYVIHDTTGITYRNDKEITRVRLNGVSVTPLTPLLLDESRSVVDHIYSIQRIR
jgi:hypothetical protein